jgi:hypothetical protein
MLVFIPDTKKTIALPGILYRVREKDDGMSREECDASQSNSEFALRGELAWVFVEVCVEVPKGVPKLDNGRCNFMTNRKVTDWEAEQLTGLHMPVAMDRLREMTAE